MPRYSKLDKQTATVLERISDSFLVLDNKDLVVFLNKQAEKVFTTPRNNLIGKNIFSLYPGLKKTKTYSLYQKAQKTGKAQQIEEYFPTFNLWFRVSIYPSSDETSIYLHNLSKHKRSEKEREETLKLLNAIIDTAPIGFVLYDKKLTYRRVNKWLSEINNVPINKHIGKKPVEIVPSAGSKIQKNVKKVFTSGKQITSIEFSGKSNSNEDARYWQSSYFPIFSSQKEVMAVGAFVRDVTQRKKAEIQLKKREQEFRQLLQSTDQGIYGIDRKGNCTFINQAAADMIGVSYKQVIGKNMHRIVHHSTSKREPYPAEKCPIIHALTKNEGARVADEVFWKKDGSFFPVEYSSYPIIEDGKTVGAVVTFNDITKRKEYEEALRVSETRFKALFNANIIGVSIENAEGKVLEANDAFLNILGYTRQDMHEGLVNWKEATPPEYKRLTEKMLKRLIEKGINESYEKEYIRKDGTRIPVVVGNAVLDHKKKEGISFVLDITDQKEAEKRKDEFIGMASHELKNPITTIKAYAQFLQRYLQDYGDQDAVDYLSKMDKQIDRLTGLITELLDVTKINTGKLQLYKKMFNLDEVVEDAIENVRITAKKHRIIKLGKSRAMVEADRDRLSQVMINLLTNAIKYSPQSKKVIVKTTRKNGTITVAVQDFGIGIPKNRQKKIFERFYRINNQQSRGLSNLGLGLYIAREIIKLHKGKIWVESVEGKGATFYFTLPVAG